MTNLQVALARLWEADEKAGMLHSRGTWVPWGEIRSLSERIDSELTSAGCGAGGRVAVVLGNRAESVAALIAIMGRGRTLVTVSPLQPPERLSADLVETDASFVLAPEWLWSQGVFAAAVAELGAAGWSVEGESVVMTAQPARAPAHHDASVAVEMPTSGTTGPPKRVPLTWRQLEASLSAALRHNDRPSTRDVSPFTGSVSIVVTPVVHIGGLWGLLESLVAARPFVMLERFTLDAWHAAVKQHRPIVVGLPPPAIRAILDANVPADDLSSVRAVNSGTSPVDPELVDEFYERYGIPILIVYGATEFCGAVAGWTIKDFRALWNEKKGSVGRAFPGIDLRVIDDDGDVVPFGQPGRLQVASAQSGNSDEHWVTTNDLARIDHDGFLYIDGRADDVILRGGFKVAPETVLKALRGHDAVTDAAVAGVPDPRLGQIPIAAVQLRNGASVAAEELRTHCRLTLSPYEVPVEIFVVDELPRGAALKVDRRRLFELFDELRAQQSTATGPE